MAQALGVIRKIVRFVLLFLAACTMLLLLLVGAILLPPVQTWVVKKAANYLENKLQTTVTLHKIYIAFPDELVIKGLYVEDQQQDTLLYLGELKVDIAMTALLRSKVQVNYVGLRDVTARIHREENGERFNFSFIPEAFASDTTDEPPKDEPDSPSAWTVDVQKVRLDRIRGSFLDDFGGMETTWNLGHFSVQVHSLDLEQERVHIRSIETAHTDIQHRQLRLPPVSEQDDESGEIPGWEITLDALNWEHINLRYAHLPDSTDLELNLGSLQLEPLFVSLKDQHVRFNKVHLAHSSVNINNYAVPEEQLSAESDEPSLLTFPDIPWRVEGNQLLIENQHIAFSNHAVSPAPGFDANHLHLQNLLADIQDIYISDERQSLRWSALSFQEQSGLELRHLGFDLDLRPDTLVLNDLLLQTGNSSAALSLELGYPTRDVLLNNPEQSRFRLHLPDLSFAWNDLFAFMPSLKEQETLASMAGTSVSLQALLEGDASQISIKQLRADALQETHADVYGSLLNPQDEPEFDIKIKTLRTGKHDLGHLMGEAANEFQLPRFVKVSGIVAGKTNDLSCLLDVQSDLATLHLDASYLMPPDSLPEYTATLLIDPFELGIFLNQPDTLGPFCADVHLTGKGLDPQTATADVDVLIHEMSYTHWMFTDVSLKSSLHNGELVADLAVNDSLIALDLGVVAEPWLKVPHATGRLSLHGLDASGAGLAENDMRVRGQTEFSIIGDTLSELLAMIRFDDWDFFSYDKRYHLDSLVMNFSSQTRSTSFSVHSDFMEGSFEGNLAATGIGDAVMRHVRYYYHFGDTIESAKRTDAEFDFSFTFHSTNLLTQVLIPDLERFTPGVIKGSFREQQKHLDVDIRMPETVYAGFHLDSLHIYLRSDSSLFTYDLAFQEAGTEAFSISNFRLYGNLQDQILSTTVSIVDSADYQSLLLSGYFQSIGGRRFEFRLQPDGVIMANEPWQVSEEHVFAFGEGGVWANNLSIAQNHREVKLQSRDTVPNAPLDLSFRRFNLADLASAIDSEGDFVEGKLSGVVAFSYPETGPELEADLNIDQLGYREMIVGDLSLHMENTPIGADLDMHLTGVNNELTLEGSIHREPENEIDIALNIARINLGSFQPFLDDVQDLTGTLTGGIAVSGNPEKPVYDGDITLIETSFFVPLLGVGYSLDKETVSASNAGIRVDKFTLRDDEGKTAIINGMVATHSLTDIVFELDLDMDQFSVLRVAESTDALFYGNAKVNSTVRLRGDLNQPKVRAQASLAKGSSLKLVVPESEARAETAGGINAFVDVHGRYSDVITRKAARDPMTSALQGVDLRANLVLNRETELTLFLDETKDNFIDIQGDADLVFGVDPSGKVTLSGRYEVDRGVYQLVYRTVIRRKFELEQGSSIVWLGDPLDARIDFRATHVVRTDALGLLRDQSPNMSREEMGRYRQELPFEVRLIMTEYLLEPDIGFELGLPDAQRGALGGQVNNRLMFLNQPESESERNKQVFSLLVLGHFLPADPLAGSGRSMASTARSSMADVLNSQIRRVTEEYVKGVDLNLSLDSYEDYTTGQAEGRTQLNVGVSKELFNERITVHVGGSIDLEGDQRRTQNASDLIGDLSVEYKLTPDAIWRLRGYRKNTFEGMIDGEIIRTGVALIFSRSYNATRELFENRRRQEATTQEEEPLPKGEEPEEMEETEQENE
ncbi:MAG: translocation/assembly module TamB [Cryomorphaceae bacterium]|nr:MAG: translocation/assembly module TamB [Cryomorphaceae bacterium]